MSGNTDYVVDGQGAGGKLDDPRKKGARIIGEHALEELLAG